MTTDQDLGRLLDLWVAEGIDEVNDRVLDTVEAQIGKHRQRPAWRLSWRDARVNMYVKLAAGLAAVAIVAVVGYNLLPGGSPSGGPVGSPTTAPTTAPTGSPAATGPVALAEGVLAGGRYRIDLSFIDPGLSVVGDIPAGWTGHPQNDAVTSPGGNNAGVLISFMEVDGLFSDPCHWDLDGSGSIDQPGDVKVGPTVGDLVTALQANTSYTSSSDEPFAVGGFQGLGVELQLPGEDVIRSCDQRPGESTGDYFVFPKGFYAQGSDNRWDLHVVDVIGSRVVILRSYFPETPQADVEAGSAIVSSLVFTP